MSQLWQHPYVNVFKHFNVQTWKKASKEGEVVSVMDKSLKGSVYRISGSIPAGNYLQLPKTSTQSLGLTGRFMYLLFRPLPGKYFVVHIDVATQDGLIVRVSFSNLFKEFKATSTWLQFPFVCHAAKGTIYGGTGVGSKDHAGPAPVTTRWTMLCLDLQYTLSMYLNRRYAYIKSVRLCANMLVKNIFTSDTEYEPGLTVEQVKRTGKALQGRGPVPREMAFPLAKTQDWHSLYDHIRFPSDGTQKPFDSIQHGAAIGTKAGTVEPRRVDVTNVSINKSTSSGMSMIDQLTAPKRHTRKKNIVTELPPVGLTADGNVSIEQTDDGDIHVYAGSDEEVLVHRKSKHTGKVVTSQVKPPALLPGKEKTYRSLRPDPILKLKKIVGFGGATRRDALWAASGTLIVYPCHAVIVAMNVANGHQRFFIGHTDKVASISLNGSSSLMASGQTGPQSVVRVWKFSSRECLAMFKTHVHSLSFLSMSNSGGVLCGVGKDSHSKNMVVIWNTERVKKGGEVSVLAKAHTDVDITCMRVATFDDTRMVSCGRDNIRLWRVKDGQLRSAPVNLGEHHSVEFTDCCFAAGYDATKDPLDRSVYACSRAGHIFEIDYRKVAIQHVRRLLPVPNKKGSKQAPSSGISINSMCVNEAFCVTGSDDGYLRLWPLDFAQVYLEAEHEGPVSAVDISPDGIRVLAGTTTGNLGILDVSTRSYTTLVRSHTDRVLSMALDPVRRHLATVSSDHTIRVWDVDTLQQLYDFSAPQECPFTIAFHPRDQVFAVGFESGAVRVFNVATTTMLAEHKQHRGKVVGLVYGPSGDHLYSAGSLGSLVLYDASNNGYQLLRVLANVLARGEKHGPCALTVSPDGRRVAFVGPTDFTVSVVDARSLDEVMRLDITSLNPGDSSKTVIDTAVRVHYAPANVKQLLVVTSSNKLLKFDSRSGKILSEVGNIHRSSCSSLHTSQDGRHLATAGDKVIKVWDYHMRLDLNFQVFIGHAEAISQILFTPDQLSFISCGEAIFFWDFLAHHQSRPKLKEKSEVHGYQNGIRDVSLDEPRDTLPMPESQPPDLDDISAIHRMDNAELLGAEVTSQTSDGDEREVMGDGANSDDLDGEPYIQTVGETEIILTSGASQKAQLNTDSSHHAQGLSQNEEVPKESRNTSTSHLSMSRSQQPTTAHPQPRVHKHFIQRAGKHPLAQRRYAAPPNQAGLKLQSVMGYNGNGRSNMVWHPDTGFFAYTSGCILVVEDLSEGSQKHLFGHVEEISCLALQHDCQMMASASGACEFSRPQICMWDLTSLTCKKVLSHHSFDVVSMDYSRDDRFLISIGDYRECAVVVWATYDFSIVATSIASMPIHQVSWDPYAVNEFVTVGSGGTVLFWLLDETGSEGNLMVHEAEVPKDLLQTHHMGGCKPDFTSLVFAGDSTLYIATSTGVISAWDTRHNSCFLHWEADSAEIGTLACKNARLVSGSAAGTLRLWSTAGVGDLRIPVSSAKVQPGGLTMEDEMTLDGPVVAAAFDDTMDMGIVGTGSGTLWYINWAERTSIRLVASHSSKINDLHVLGKQHLATCSADGSLRVWALQEREQTLQFQVLEQACTCLAFSPFPPGVSTGIPGSGQSVPVVPHISGSTQQLPLVAAGYSDGTVRVFHLDKVEMIMKMHPHAVAVTALNFSPDGHMILSGGYDGLVALTSPTTGMTVRVISDHKGAPITDIDVTCSQADPLDVSTPQLWLACSADRRVSVWSADWSKDSCELVDWLTFPAPAFTPEGAPFSKDEKKQWEEVPPSIAKFSREEPDILVYTGYGLQKQIQFYSMSQKKVLRTIPLTHWARSMSLCPTSPLIAVATQERLLKVVDYYEGSFQDFVGHDTSVDTVRFSPDGTLLFSVAHSEILMWRTALS